MKIKELWDLFVQAAQQYNEGRINEHELFDKGMQLFTNVSEEDNPFEVKE